MHKAAQHTTRLSAAIALALLAGCGGSETQTDINKVDPSEPVSDWTLVWSDEFSGDSIDTKNWNYELNCQGGGNNEQQCYTDDPANAYVADGMLNIVALPAAEGAEKPYTSARLNTRKKADFKYGRIEMRAKLPQGQGSWPAFWMMPTDSVYGTWPKSGEIDIMEAVNLKVANEDGLESKIYGTLHYGKDWPDNAHTGKAFEFAQDMNPADTFHEYAVEWQEGEIRWYVDGYLYATQRQSEVRYNADGEAVGLKHRGWFAEYFEQGTGELETHWDSAPFDQYFYIILNLAVGGDWPENVNDLGVDAQAFADGQTYSIDYVRVYQCAVDTDTGKGCETVRPGYDSYDDALLEGEAPIPSPPSSGLAAPLTIFDDMLNANWAAWDCCGGSTPATVADAERGEVMEFVVGEAPTVNGFTSREEFLPEGATPSPYDASSLLDMGFVRFDMKVTSAPSNPDSVWMFKAESVGASSAAEVALNTSSEGADPVVGQWQTYTFPIQALSDAGLDVSAIDVLMIFPAWGTGDGAVYQVDNVEIAYEFPELVLFEEAINPDWPLWDCCGGTTPLEVMDDADHNLVAEFSIGATPTVMGFNTRTDVGGSGMPFDASLLLDNGLLQFDMKVTSMPSTPDAPWLLKVESNGATTAVEMELSESQEGAVPEAGQWQTYTFAVSDLEAQGLDVSAIDVVMIFPAWGSGEGAVYRVDNAKIYNYAAPQEVTIFDEQQTAPWSAWDCCGGSEPSIVVDDAQHNNVVEFNIGAEPTVMGFLSDSSFDASAILDQGVVQFEMKVTSAPSNPDAQWLFKIESIDASSAVELALSESLEGQAPVVGQWQTYTFTLADLFAAGLDISAINVLMMFPSWGAGDGAVYRVDNVKIANP